MRTQAISAPIEPFDHPPARPGAVDDVAARVLSNSWANGEYKLLVAQAAGPAGSARAGQFFNLESPASGADRPFLRRPMSIYRADAETGTVEFLYKITGAGTRGLATLEPGDQLRILGPLGQGFTIDPSWKHIVLLGRGVGLATLAPLAEMAAEAHIGVTALISARGPGQVLSVERFASLGATTEILLDSDGTSAVEAVEGTLRRLHRDGLADAFFTCGSNRLMLLMQRLGAELGIPGQVALEQQMACGLGMCFSCVRNVRQGDAIVSQRVCWDGPVFNLGDALSW